MELEIVNRIENCLCDQIIDWQPAIGGCIANNSLLCAQSGKQYFLKQGCSDEVFQCEANGLNELRQSGVIMVPQVILVGNGFLLMEYIQQGRLEDRFFEHFGRQLASVHQCSSLHFGFFENNYIGRSLQDNMVRGTEPESTDWSLF